LLEVLFFFFLADATAATTLWFAAGGSGPRIVFAFRSDKGIELRIG